MEAWPVQLNAISIKAEEVAREGSALQEWEEGDNNSPLFGPPSSFEAMTSSGVGR